MASFLFQRAELYAPDYRGVKDILVVEGRIAAIGDSLDPGIPGLQKIDMSGAKALPGFIDQHVHVTGGGGEGGEHTRAPELSVEEAAECGDTTVVGVLGADVISRPVVSLLAKIRGLRREGLSTWMWTSNYAYPPTTLTGSVKLDLYTIPECLGVKVAMADTRASFMTMEELMRLVSEIRLGGRLAGKRGFRHIHLGTLGGAFGMFMDAVKRGIPMLDFTTDEPEKAADAVLKAISGGVPEDRITLSTDGHGALPVYAEDGTLQGLQTLDIRNNFRAWKILAHEIGIRRALPFLTSNVADSLLIPKGRLETGRDADLCFLRSNGELTDVMSRGVFLKREGKVTVRGTYSGTALS